SPCSAECYDRWSVPTLRRNDRCTTPKPTGATPVFSKPWTPRPSSEREDACERRRAARSPGERRSGNGRPAIGVKGRACCGLSPLLAFPDPFPGPGRLSRDSEVPSMRVRPGLALAVLVGLLVE